MNGELLRIVLFCGLIGYLLWRYLPGALLFVHPGWIRSRIVGGPETATSAVRGPAMREMAREIEDLGFEPLGLVVEKRPLGRSQRQLVYGSAEERTYAVVAPVGNEAWLRFVTHFSDGAVVITADYRWPSVEEPGYLAGGLPSGSPAEILATHRRRVQRFVDEGRSLEEEQTLEGWVRSSDRYYAKGPGKREVRRREVMGMMFTTALIVAVVLSMVRAYRR